MKPRLHYVTTFNLKLMGAMPVVALSLVLYPAIVKAQPVNENLFFSDSPSQAEKGVEYPDFSPDLENLSPSRGEALNSPHVLEQQLPPLEFDSTSSTATTDTSIPDVQPSEREVQPFLATVDLPRGLRKIAGIEDKNDRGKDSKTLLQASPTEIQPFQPATTVALPRGLSKIAGVENGQRVNQNLPVSPTISTVIKILTPTADSVVDVQATTVTVQFPVGSQVELRVNGTLVDSSLVGRTESDATTNLVTQIWYGVSLKEGNNTISAQVIGGTEPPVTVQVAVRGAPQKLTLETVESRIPADGRSTATIRGQLIDASGNRSNRDAVVTIIPTAGELVGADFKPNQPGFQVEAKKGQFTATLRSQLKAETVTIRAIANNLEAFTQLQFETALRPSLVTGVIDLRLGARGTNYYGSFRDFLPPDKNNGTQLDFHSAVFATGAIGEWLFTGAYNSSRSLNEDCDCNNRLFRTYQSSEQNYPVYGDSSKVDVVAPSIDSVYLRFERSTGIPGASPDYAMWGDYNTEEFARRSQQFTSITRQLHGFKANYNFGNLQITGLYGNHLEAFQRDTIAPDGTSGYYFLSRRLLQAGSENVFIELEELNRPGTVLQRKQLNRGPDYEIDYDRGTLIFREPILRTDIDQTGQVLVRRIVVTYQYDSQDSDSSIYAGRLQYNLSRKLNQQSWIGATYVQENQGVRDFQLYGADALIALGTQGRLIAEYAHSSNDSDVVGKVRGDAYRLEAEGQIANGIQGRAYYRFADTGFANNATISFVPGQTRYGAQVTAKVTSSTNVRVQYDQEDNFGIAPQPLDTFEELFSPRSEAIPGSKVDNSLTTISAGIQQRLGKATLDVDWIHRHREDRIPDSALSGNSDQLRSRFSVPIAKNLTFQAQNELSLSSQKDTVYPDRTILGLNWALIPGVSVGLAQQYYSSGQYSGNSITSLSVNGEHKLGSDTTLTGRYSILGGANEMTTQGAIGLNNRWTIASGLRLNVAYEHVFGNFFGRTGAGQQYAQPFAFGQSASAIGFDGGDSYSVGLEYSDNPQFQASARYEHRSSSGGGNTVITAAAAGKISPALTALVRYQQAGSSNQALSGLGDTANLKLGLAYRDPNNDKFNALLRYEYRQNPATIPDTILLGSGTGSQDHTFALEAIYAPNWQWEFYGKYALRNSTSYIASDLAGTSTVNLAQLRATYRLGYSWDLVGEARVISQSSYSETGFVIETGYYLTPNLRVSAGYVFGKVDDRDFSGTRSAGGAYLGFTVKLNELFDGFGQQKIPPRQPQESAMKTLVGKLKAATRGIQKREI
ncbi:MAG: Ig-like domain-containing protein [Nostoc sp.]